MDDLFLDSPIKIWFQIFTKKSQMDVFSFGQDFFATDTERVIRKFAPISIEVENGEQVCHHISFKYGYSEEELAWMVFSGECTFEGQKVFYPNLKKNEESTKQQLKINSNGIVEDHFDTTVGNVSFHKIFRQICPELETVNLSNFKQSSILCLRHYFCTGSPGEITNENLVELIEMSSLIHFVELKNECQRTLKSILDFVNFEFFFNNIYHSVLNDGSLFKDELALLIDYYFQNKGEIVVVENSVKRALSLVSKQPANQFEARFCAYDQMLQNLKNELFSTKQYSDIILESKEGKQIKAHKCIIGSADIFKHFYSDNVCKMECSFDSIDAFLRLIYLGSITQLTIEVLVGIYPLIHQCHHEQTSNDVVQFLTGFVKEENAKDMLDFIFESSIENSRFIQAVLIKLDKSPKSLCELSLASKTAQNLVLHGLTQKMIIQQITTANVLEWALALKFYEFEDLAIWNAVSVLMDKSTLFFWNSLMEKSTKRKRSNIK